MRREDRQWDESRQRADEIQKDEGSRNGARKRVHAQRGTAIDKPGQKSGGMCRGTCDEKVFRFRVYVVPGYAIRIALELARKGRRPSRGGSSM